VPKGEQKVEQVEEEEEDPVWVAPQLQPSHAFQLLQKFQPVLVVAQDVLLNGDPGASGLWQQFQPVLVVGLNVVYGLLLDVLGVQVQ